MALSAQRQTAETLLAAFNAMDLAAIASLRAPDCVRQILPSTLGYPPSGNAQYTRSLAALLTVFANFSLTCHELVEDAAARKIAMYLRARADTDAGEYVNEYVWFLAFDAQARIVRVDEFVDTVMNRDFWPKLQAAMDAAREKEAAAVAAAAEPTG
ncbi:hypothetical protein MBLNU459_g6464t1, partial [Dothideomycetes sp. NU459]